MRRFTLLFVAALLCATAAFAAEEAPAAAPAAPPAEPAAAQPAPAAPPAEPAAPVIENRMRKPEISTPALTGLLVMFTFLAIFLPGFMCLWSIQGPQTFEVVEAAGPLKKNQ